MISYDYVILITITIIINEVLIKRYEPTIMAQGKCAAIALIMGVKQLSQASAWKLSAI